MYEARGPVNMPKISKIVSTPNIVNDSSLRETSRKNLLKDLDVKDENIDNINIVYSCEQLAQLIEEEVIYSLQRFMI